MKRLFAFLLCGTALFAQSGSYVSNQIPLSAFNLGAGTTLVTLADGSQAIDAGYGSQFSVDLGVTPQQLQANPAHPGYFLDGVYVLSFAVVNYFPSYPGYYEVEVDFGTQELCEASGWGTRYITQVTVTCPGPAYIVVDKAQPGGGPVQGSHNLVIHGLVPGWQMYFNKFSLPFTPVN